MTLRILVFMGLGICSVLQAGLNRKMALQSDLSRAALMNNAVLFLVSALIFFVVIFNEKNAGSVGIKPPFSFEIWQLMPGILGVCLVAGIPWAIAKWGSASVFIGLMTSQILAALVWDLFIENRNVGMGEIVGASLSLLGLVFVNLKSGDVHV